MNSFFGRINKLRYWALLLSGLMLAGAAAADRGDRRLFAHRGDGDGRSSLQVSMAFGSPGVFVAFGDRRHRRHSRHPRHRPPRFFQPHPFHAGFIAWAPPPTIIIPAPAPAPVYIQRAPVAPAPAAPTLDPGYWYYCAESGGYYPYVDRCSGSWIKTPPRPAQ